MAFLQLKKPHPNVVQFERGFLLRVYHLNFLDFFLSARVARSGWGLFPLQSQPVSRETWRFSLRVGRELRPPSNHPRSTCRTSPEENELYNPYPRAFSQPPSESPWSSPLASGLQPALFPNLLGSKHPTSSDCHRRQRQAGTKHDEVWMSHHPAVDKGEKLAVCREKPPKSFVLGHSERARGHSLGQVVRIQRYIHLVALDYVYRLHWHGLLLLLRVLVDAMVKYAGRV